MVTGRVGYNTLTAVPPALWEMCLAKNDYTHHWRGQMYALADSGRASQAGRRRAARADRPAGRATAGRAAAGRAANRVTAGWLVIAGQTLWDDTASVCVCV